MFIRIDRMAPKMLSEKRFISRYGELETTPTPALAKLRKPAS